MRSEQPPVVATWLLERFCADAALAGDLMEEYRERNSTAWPGTWNLLWTARRRSGRVPGGPPCTA